MWLTGCPSEEKSGGDGVAIDRGVYGDRGLDSDEALLGAGGAAVLCALPSRWRAVRERRAREGADMNDIYQTPLRP